MLIYNIYNKSYAKTVEWHGSIRSPLSAEPRLRGHAVKDELIIF